MKTYNFQTHYDYDNDSEKIFIVKIVQNRPIYDASTRYITTNNMDRKIIIV